MLIGNVTADHAGRKIRLLADTQCPELVPVPPDTAKQIPSPAIVSGKLSIYVVAAVEVVLVAGVITILKYASLRPMR
jgi:hypothetical protein